MSATKEKHGPEKALELARAANKVIVARGKKVVEYDMKKDPPGEEVLLKGMLGPTGNLRAPTMVIGKTVYVGFEPDSLGKLLG